MDKLEQLKRHVNNGHLDIAKLDQNNKPVKVDFEDFEQKTKDLNNHQKLFKMIQGLSWQEKYEWVNTRRLKGNQLYKKGQIKDAVSTYVQSLIGLERNNANESQNQIVRMELEFPILLNMATCFYKEKDYQKGIKLCDQVLSACGGEKYSKHPQALYKKANFLFELGQYQQAKKLLGQQDQDNDRLSTSSSQDSADLKHQHQQQDKDNEDSPILYYEDNCLKKVCLYIKQAYQQCCSGIFIKSITLEQKQAQKMSLIKSKQN